MRPNYKKLFTENAVSVGLSTTIGKQKQQGDSLHGAVQAVGYFKLLKDRESTLRATFDEIQHKHGNYSSIESTGCCAVAWLEEDSESKLETINAYIAHLGNSPAFMIIVDQAGIVNCERLTDMGNRGKFGPRQHTHTPEILYRQKTLMPGQKAFVIVASDGLLENPFFDQTAISDIMNIHHEKSLQRISYELQNAAASCGAEDNISVATFAVTKTPTSAAIFDGNKQCGLSNLLGQHFYPTLENHIQQNFLIERKKQNDQPLFYSPIKKGSPQVAEIQHKARIYCERKLKELDKSFIYRADDTPEVKKIKLDVAIHDAIHDCGILPEKTKLLVLKYHYANELKSMRTLSVMKSLLTPEARQTMHEARGFWHWIAEKLHFPEEKKTPKFFDKKINSKKASGTMTRRNTYWNR